MNPQNREKESMTDERKLGTVKALDVYHVVKGKFVEGADPGVMVLEHKKSGAELLLLSNEDDSKVLYIGPHTPPEDSIGLSYILEHSVLEGSEKFPVEDPFVELVRGSLDTFLNAMTYPNRTVYPVTSYNEKDFQNLMDVYLDGVLHPAIYKELKIFLQEGWHCEIQSPEDKLTINRMVCSEMKGTFSSPESVLDRSARNALLPGSAYVDESGGGLSVIPDLTYEQFAESHKNCYHSANNYICLYGDMDMAEKLKRLDREYFSGYDRKDCHADSSIPLQKTFEDPVEKEITYSVTEKEGTADRTYLSMNMMVGTNLDPVLYIAFNILECALINVSGAPLKQALIDAEVGQDVLGGYGSGTPRPYFTVIARDINREQKGEFLSATKGTLYGLADQGIDRESLRTGSSYYEFRSREADYGSASKGLMYGLGAVDSWLYGRDLLVCLEYQKAFEFLDKAMDKGYFEQLIHAYLLDSPHEIVVIVSPRANQAAREDRRLAGRLAAYKASLGNEEIARLVVQTKALKDYQEETSSQKDLEEIPMLQREDTDRKSVDPFYQLKMEDGARIAHSSMSTPGIGYLKVLFNTDRVPMDGLPYVGLLKSVPGYVDAENYIYSNLSSEIYLSGGGINFVVSSYPDVTRPGEFTGAFVAGAKVFYGKLGLTFSMLTEILTQSRLEDEKRLGEVLDETCSRTRVRMEDSSHDVAVRRASSCYNVFTTFSDIISGIGYYQFLEYVSRRYSEGPEHGQALIGKLKDTVRLLFTSDNILVSYTTDEGRYGHLSVEPKSFKASLPAERGRQYRFTFEKGNRGEGYKTAPQVNYVARYGSFAGKRADGKELMYTGTLRVLKVILNYGYLRVSLRVEGGVYGCISGFGRSGDGYLVSYRDSNIANTNQIYEGIPEYLKGFSIDEQDTTKYVVGTTNDVDIPLTPSPKGSRNLSVYLFGVTMDTIQQGRDEILNVTQEDTRSPADIVRAVLSTGALYMIGNDKQIKADRDMLEETKNLYH